MKHVFTLLLALALLAPVSSVLADHDGTDATHDEPTSTLSPKEPVLPKPNIPLPPKPGTERAELLRENVQERRDVFIENTQQRQEFRQTVGSTTRGVPPVRPPQFAPPTGVNAIGRPAFSSTTPQGMFRPRETFSSTTKQAILERRGDFASTTKAIVMERRALFASSTAARIMDMRENKEERREHFASTTALKRAEFTEDMKVRILEHAEHAAELLDAMLGRLAGIAERIAERIERLSEEGVDTTLAEAELAEAYDAIEAAQAAVEATKTQIAGALESDTPREMIPAAKTAGDAAKAALRAAHQALQEAAQALPKLGAPTGNNI